MTLGNSLTFNQDYCSCCGEDKMKYCMCKCLNKKVQKGTLKGEERERKREREREGEREILCSIPWCSSIFLSYPYT
jgi:hypothetical protein